MTWLEALAKFSEAADWSREQFKAAVARDPFWAEVKKHYSRPPERDVVYEGNPLLQALRKK